MLNENKQLDAKIQKARELQRQTEALIKYPESADIYERNDIYLMRHD